MSPRYPVDAERNFSTSAARSAVFNRDADEDSGDPYRAQHGNGYTVTDRTVPVHSYFRDLVVLKESDVRAERSLQRALAQGGRGGRDEGSMEPPPPGWPHDTVEAARRRLEKGTMRDLSAANAGDVLRPYAPGFIGDVFGAASRSAGTLVDAIGPQPLEAGAIDTSSGIPVLSVPRLSGGPAVAVQASQNSGIQETDATTTSASSPVATIAGMNDVSRQLLDFSRPGIDAVISQELGRDFGTKADVQIVNGSASSGQTRGLLNVSGILSVAGSITSAATFLESVWKAYSALAGGSGIGNPEPSAYLTILHPRRLAWVRGNTTGIQAQALFPGTVVASAGIPSNLGASTNEDVALVVERESVLLAMRQPAFKVAEDPGSGTLTVRLLAYGMLSLVAFNPAGIARVTGLTPPSGF